MNLKELTAIVAKETGLTKHKTLKLIRAITRTIETELRRDGRVELPKFGIFDCRLRKARVMDFGGGLGGRRIEMPDNWEPRFKASGALKMAVRDRIQEEL